MNDNQFENEDLKNKMINTILLIIKEMMKEEELLAKL